MAGIVYVLQSSDGRYYIGSTTDLDRRIKQHLSKHTYSTTRMKGLRLIFSQEFDSLKTARIIERKIKSWKRKDFIDKIIKDGFIKYRPKY